MSSIGLAGDVGHELLGGGIGKHRPAVSAAHDDGLAHRPDDRIQLGGASVLGLGEPLEADLDLDPVGDVACDRDDRRRSALGGQRLQDDLDREGRTARGLDLGHDRRGAASAGRDLVDETRQSRGIGGSHEVREGAADHGRRDRARTGPPRPG